MMGSRRWFHVLLGAAFLPCLSLPLVWGGAIYWLRRATEPEDRRWAKRILGLAVVDTLLLIALGILVATMDALPMEPSSPQPRVVIGVTPDSSFQGPGVRLASVIPASPAEVAGLQVGDVVKEVAGNAVGDFDTMRRIVADQEPGKPLQVTLIRGGSATTVEVTPQWSNQLPQRQERQVGLFEPPSGDSTCFSGAAPLLPRPWLIILGGMAALGLLAARRGSGRGVWLTGLSILSAIAGTYVAAGGACALLGGPSAAGGVFAMWGSSLGLAGTALIARRFMEKPPYPPPTLAWGPAVGLGFWYALTGAVRLSTLLTVLRWLTPASAAPLNPIGEFGQGLGSMDGPGLLLLALPVIFFGPVGEELAFRGLLLPSLSTWAGTTVAIAMSAVIFAGMHWYYGVMLPVVVLYGAVFGWAKIATGGLRAPIILHMLANAISFLPIALRAM
jgi:uncharacterized protein